MSKDADKKSKRISNDNMPEDFLQPNARVCNNNGLIEKRYRIRYGKANHFETTGCFVYHPIAYDSLLGSAPPVNVLFS